MVKPEEIADITNVILLAKADGGTREHLYQPDKETLQEQMGSDVKQELKNRNIALFPCTNVSIDWDG